MKKLRIQMLSVLLVLGTFGFSQGNWNYVNNSGTDFILYGMSFPAGQNDIGYACGMQYTYNADGVIVKTTDGGENWTQILPVSGDIDGLQSIWFTDENTGFAVGWNNYFIKTTDGGATWTNVTCGSNVWYYTDIKFWDEDNGVVSASQNGSDPGVYVTEDGGDTWVAASSGITSNIWAVDYAGENIVYAININGFLYKSNDGGYNWTQLALPGAMLMGIDFVTEDFGVIGAEERIYATIDGGTSWTEFVTGYENFYAVEAYPDGKAYVGGTDENIYVTYDHGNNWTMEFNGTGTSSLYRMRTVENGTTFSCGSQGAILYKEPEVTMDYSLSFDGNNDYVSMGDIDVFDIEPGESFTFCTWFKLNAQPDYQRILCKRDGGNPGYEIWLNNQGQLAVNIRTSQMEDMSYWSNSYASIGSWHFVSFVIDADEETSAVYFDGFLSATNAGEALSHGVSSDADFVLGARSIQDYFLNGVIDEVSLWKTALTQGEIQDVMNGSLTGNEPGLEGYWRFDDQGAMATDYTSNGFDGTIYGAQYVTNDNLYFTDMEYQSSECNQDNVLYPAGRGNANEPLLALNIQTQGSLNPFSVVSLNVNLNGSSDLDDLDSVRIIYCGINPNLNSYYQVEYPAVVPVSGDINFTINKPLFHGNNYFWLVGDVGEEAAEGNLLDAHWVDFSIDGNQAGTYVPDNPSPSGDKSIILAHKALFVSGTEDVHTFRIPAIVTTDQGTLIAATDARVDNGADLGWTGNIDIVYKRSTDNGVTWSEMLTAADFPGVEGASDCSMIFDEVTNEIFMFYNYADETDDFQWPYMIKSSDDGLSWSPFENLNEAIYHPSWTWAFVTSGRGIQKSDGSLRHVINVMEGNTPGALIFGSDDHGETWYSVQSPLSPLANESKLVQLDDGSLMMNCRQENTNKRLIGQTDDDGNNWYNMHYDNTLIEPKCNASFIRYTSILDGYAKSRLLFSNPASTTARVNMKVRLSYDEGETWTEGKVINPGSSAYSSLTVLDDHSIGLFYEAGGYKEIKFARFSLNWLTDGADTLQLPVRINKLIDTPGLEVYPNPATEEIHIQLNYVQRCDQVDVVLKDMSGMTVIKEQFLAFENKFFTIPTHNLKLGTYIVTVIAGEQRFYRKVVKI